MLSNFLIITEFFGNYKEERSWMNAVLHFCKEVSLASEFNRIKALNLFKIRWLAGIAIKY